MPAKVRSETPSWTAEEVGTFLASVRSDHLYPAFLTLVTTGLRRSELLGLRWADVDLDAGSLKVRQVVSLDKYTPFLAEPKTARSRRVVALDPGTVAVLRSHRNRQREERMAAGPAWQANDLVFAREDGTILHPQSPSGAFERAAKAAALPPIGIHGLRHSHASLGLANNVPLVIMSDRLGHSSVAITSDVYSHTLRLTPVHTRRRISSTKAIPRATSQCSSAPRPLAMAWLMIRFGSAVVGVVESTHTKSSLIWLMVRS